MYPHFLFPGAEKKRVSDAVQDGESIRNSEVYSEAYTFVFLLEQLQSDLRHPVNIVLSLTEHDGVDDESHDVLHDEEGDGRRTLLRYHPPSEADGHLNLDGEQEGRRERPGERKSFCLKAVSVSFCFRANSELLADLMGKAALNVSDV